MSSRTNLTTWNTRNPIEVHAYDVEADISWLEDLIVKTYNSTLSSDFKIVRATSAHTIVFFLIDCT